MAKLDMSILDRVASGEITSEEGKRLLALSNSRKLRGVTVTARESEAFEAYIETGNFRVFMTNSGAKNTAVAQQLIAKCARAKFEVSE